MLYGIVMKTRTDGPRYGLTLAVALPTILACSSGSSSGPSDMSGTDGGLQSASCNQIATSGSCEITPTAPALLPNAANICMQEGGTPGTSCPTANLVGCCTISGGEQCYYSNSMDAPDAQENCVGGGGTWSTKI